MSHSLALDSIVCFNTSFLHCVVSTCRKYSSSWLLFFFSHCRCVRCRCSLLFFHSFIFHCCQRTTPWIYIYIRLVFCCSGQCSIVQFEQQQHIESDDISSARNLPRNYKHIKRGKWTESKKENLENFFCRSSFRCTNIFRCVYGFHVVSNFFSSVGPLIFSYKEFALSISSMFCPLFDVLLCSQYSFC